MPRICDNESVLNMPRERQESMVESAYVAGVGLRQLSRITKISYGAIVTMRRKSTNKVTNNQNRPFNLT